MNCDSNYDINDDINDAKPFCISYIEFHLLVEKASLDLEEIFKRCNFRFY